MRHAHTTKLELLDLTRQHKDFSNHTAPSRSAYIWETRMILYLNWLHQRTVRSLCSNLFWFGRFIVITDKTRAEMSLQNIYNL